MVSANGGWWRGGKDERGAGFSPRPSHPMTIEIKIAKNPRHTGFFMYNAE